MSDTAKAKTMSTFGAFGQEQMRVARTSYLNHQIHVESSRFFPRRFVSQAVRPAFPEPRRFLELYMA